MFLQQLLNAISVGSMYAMLAVGFSLVYNILGIVNFSHGATIALGAYGAYWLSTYFKLPLIPALFLAVLLSGLLSLATERITLRPLRRKGQPSIFFFIASLTVFNLTTASVIYISKGNITSYPSTVLSGNLTFGGLIIPTLDAAMLAIAVLALSGLTLVLYRTRLGLAIRSSSYDLKAAQLMGINPDFVIAGTFLFAGLLGGIGGALLGAKYAVYPEIGDMVFRAFFACMVGGLGSLTGAIYGGLLIGALEVFSNAYLNSAISPAITFSLLVLVLLVRPQGIAGKLVEEKI
ncbi:MAG: branched-chain amino acid ABC transporter permease [Chitinophagales bacterium]